MKMPLINENIDIAFETSLILSLRFIFSWKLFNRIKLCVRYEGKHKHYKQKSTV